MRADTRELKREYNRQVGNVDQFTATATLQYIFDGGGFGYGIWFAARRELLRRGLLIPSADGGPDAKMWRAA